MMIKVSIIVPVFNRAWSLDRCLESLCNQTLQEIEIICIDDGSTDASLNLLYAWAEKDTRVRVVEMELNRGEGAARNAGLLVATGEFVGFVDSDDYVDLDYYEKLYRTAVDHESDIARCQLIDYAGDQKRICRADFDYSKKYLFDIHFTTAIYRRSVLQNNSVMFPVGIKNYLDVAFLVQAVFFANKVAFTDSVFYHRMDSHDSISSSNTANSESLIFETLKSTHVILDFLNHVRVDIQHYDHVFYSALTIVSYIARDMSSIHKSTLYYFASLIRKYSSYNNCDIFDVFYRKNVDDMFFMALHLIKVTWNADSKHAALQACVAICSGSLHVEVLMAPSQASLAAASQRARQLVAQGHTVLFLIAQGGWDYTAVSQLLNLPECILLETTYATFLAAGARAARSGKYFRLPTQQNDTRIHGLRLAGALHMLSPRSIHAHLQENSLDDALLPALLVADDALLTCSSQEIVDKIQQRLHTDLASCLRDRGLHVKQDASSCSLRVCVASS